MNTHDSEQAEITAAWEERHAPYMPAEPGPDAKRWYVTVTWDGWPEGGSYGTVVTADDSDEAEKAVFWEMAQSQMDLLVWDSADEAEIIESFGYEWHVVDCFDLDEFITKHAKPNECRAALGQLLEQVYQMEKMFPGDEALELAIQDAEDALS